MKKKIILTVLMLILPFIITVVHADMGPKPSIDLTFEGLGEGTYYASIFGGSEPIGPNRPFSMEYQYESIESYKKRNSNIPGDVIDRFVEYTSGEYCFWGVMYTIDKENNKVSWGYYAPSEFMVVVITPDGKLITSEPYQRSVLAGYYKCTLSDDGITLSDNYNYGLEALKLVGRAFATIVIELLIGLLFGYRSKPEVKRIVITNVITQLILNLGVSLGSFIGGVLRALLFMIVLEFIIIFIEGAIYSNKLSGKNWLIWVYTILANVASFFLGTWLLILTSVN
ncbi:MAG: hypothetical protein IIZ74_05295 [Erysipelotrichaceae bacterium]|nr:hypothetical protein [Erysipelotrichaceae bacterium]